MDLSMEEKVLSDIQIRIQALREKENTGLSMPEEGELADLEAQQEYLGGIIAAKKKEEEAQAAEQQPQPANEIPQPTEEINAVAVDNPTVPPTQWTEDPNTPTLPEENQESPNLEETQVTVDSFLNALVVVGNEMINYQSNNKTGRPFSLAITKIEEAQMWLARAVEGENNSEE